MDTARIFSMRIHPAIGIARVGDSESFFVGPELPWPSRREPGFYKDERGRLKRQAARFRVYAYAEDGTVLGEVTSENAEITWRVHVANKKAAWYDFDVALDIDDAVKQKQQSQRRNAAFVGDDRSKLVVDPGSRCITSGHAEPQIFDTGEFCGVPVYLGELQTDRFGRLLFLGGRGVSSDAAGETNPTTFANNDGWHDDTSDGPVHATVVMDGKSFEVDGAWVVTAPPNYAPDIVTPQTMYDVIYDAHAGAMLPATWKPSFRDDVLPVLQQMVDAQWVNAGFLATFGFQGPWEFLRDDLLRKLAHPKSDDGDDPYRELRTQVFNQMRSPDVKPQQTLGWPALYGDAFGNFYDSPQVYFSLTRTKIGLLKRWAAGDFEADLDDDPERPQSVHDLPLADQPATLDMSALHWCMGGPFHPGCEMTWPMRQQSMYRAPFRVRERPGDRPEADHGPFISSDLIALSDGPFFWSAPGDITRWMAVPWQTDTASCRSGYTDWSPGTNPFPDETFIPTFWPSRVPNDVLTRGQFEIVADPDRPLDERMRAFHHRVRWLRGLNYDGPYIPQIARMVKEFGDLGVVEAVDNPNGPDDPFPRVLHVESRPTLAASEEVLARAHRERATLKANPEFTAVRFGRYGRR